MMRSLEGVQAVAAHDRVAGDAALAAAGRHLADDLALQGLLVERALAGHHERRPAHQGIEADRVEHVGRSRNELAPSAPQSPPERPPAAPGHRHAARIAREARGQLVESRSSRSTIAGSAPF